MTTMTAIHKQHPKVKLSPPSHKFIIRSRTRTRTILLILVIIIFNVVVFYRINLLPKSQPNVILPINDDLDRQLNGKLKELERPQSISNIPQESFTTINIPEIIPEIQPYDPRYTFGLLLHYINNQETQIKTIPVFHWADYVDMSPINDHFLSPEKKDCKWLDQTKPDAKYNAQNYIFKHTSYCIEDKDIPTKIETSANQEFVAKLKQILKQKFSTGIHVFDIVGRTKPDLRPFVSKSYLHDFMPVPHRMIMLFPSEKAVVFDIATDLPHRQKISQGLPLHPGNINIKQEISSIMEKIPSRITSLPAEKELVHEQFVDITSKRISELQQSPSLSFTDQHYLNSLKFSLAEKNPTKYFSEGYILKNIPGFSQGAHYDWRFMNEPINKTPKLAMSIHSLLHAWLKFTNLYNLNTWVAHGSLLGWYWNGMQFPWDGDVDVQMPITDLHKLAQLFNQSIVVDFGNDLDQGIRYGKYFVDVSSSISHRDKGNGKNNIDARFIDIDTGLYVDITGLAISETKGPEKYDSGLRGTKFGRDKKGVTEIERNEHLKIYNCRNKHFSKLDELSPLKLTLVEGEFAYVPEQFTTILIDEYNTKSLSVRDYRSMVFISYIRNWVDRDKVLNVITHGDKDRKQRLSKIKITPDLNTQDAIKLLIDNEEILQEYLITKGLTEIHARELHAILGGISSSSVFFDEETNSLIDLRLTVRQDLFTWSSQLNNYNWDKEIKKYTEKCAIAEEKLGAVKESQQLQKSSQKLDKKSELVKNEEKPEIVETITPNEDPNEDPNQPKILQQANSPRERLG